MDTPLPQPRYADAERLVRTYGDLLYRVCLIQLKNPADAEDAVQDTFVRLLQKAPDFSSAEHERAWLLRVAVNLCRDKLRTRARHGEVPLEEAPDGEPDSFPPSDSGILRALAALPEKYRLALTLYYVEDRPIAEIAKVIGRTPSAVKMRLAKGRALLEEAYRKEFTE